MVELVEDLSSLENHAQYCREILYKVEDATEGYRVRIRAGRFGWDAIVSDAKEIQAWLRSVGAVKMKGSVSDELFFA